MPLCTESVPSDARIRRLCILFCISAVVCSYCASVVVSYLFLSHRISELTFVFTVFGCCTFLTATTVSLLLIFWCATGRRDRRQRTASNRTPSRRHSWLRRLSSFPRRSPTWTVSSNPLYSGEAGLRSVLYRLPSDPTPPVPVPLVVFSEGLTEDSHPYAEIEDVQV
ncbi:ORF20A [Fowl aviadenovirus D]|uniref:ORF20A n=2 Tax=Fowl aviadenovirus D TaxID=190064 RepID=A0A191ULK8_9ADEN|nr:ORF20A [Fowl aviadenovirus D]ANJ02391.1 ORF20A [Fowl aviadenovirus 2]QGQ62992.1 ORF20A [Fowl aviadenovirus D]UYD40956.1 hypothetical protein [Fowl aviadenovirus D]